MARSAFGGTTNDWLFDPYTFGERRLLSLEAGTVTLDFYSAITGGTHYTDLLNAAAAAVSSITVTGHQVPRFSGPDGILGMWADKGDGTPREYMEARDLAAAAAALVDAEGFADDAAASAAASAAAAAATAGTTVVSLATYGATPAASAATNAAGFTAAAAELNAGTIKNLWIPGGTYNVIKTEGQNLMALSGIDGVRIVGGGAILNDSTTYTNGGAFTTMFHFTDCKDVEVRGIEYVGPAIGTPATNHGYQGAIFVRAVTGCDGVKVDARLTNLRYGVQTGEYGDASKGGCKNLDIRIRGTMIGYPIAAYYADGIRLDLDVDGVHRTAYLAGCNDVTGAARWKNTYVATPTVLFTDCLTSGTDAVAQVAPPANPTTSRGCTNIDITSIEGPSTVSPAAGQFCAGILMSRVDPGTAFRNINVKVSSVAESNTVSHNTGAFALESGAKAVWSRYANNWESTILIENLTVSGLIDHSAASVAGQDMYLIGFDGSAAVTIRNFTADDLTIVPSSASAQKRFIPGRRRDPWALDSGQASHPRGDINSVANLTTTGVIRFAYFTCGSGFVTTQAKITSGGTAAGATPTLVKMGLYTVDTSGNLTRVAVTASDTALLAAANTAYTKAWAASYTMVPGQQYAVGILVVTGATAPTLLGHAMVTSLDAFTGPRMCGTASDTDMASSYTVGSTAAGGQRPYIQILP